MPKLPVKEEMALALLDVSKIIKSNDNIYSLISNNKNNDTANTFLSSFSIFIFNTTIFNSLSTNFLVDEPVLKPNYGKSLMHIAIYLIILQKPARMT